MTDPAASYIVARLTYMETEIEDAHAFLDDKHIPRRLPEHGILHLSQRIEALISGGTITVPSPRLAQDSVIAPRSRIPGVDLDDGDPADMEWPGGKDAEHG